MIALKVEKIGDQVAAVLTEEALEVLGAEVGCTLSLEPARDGVICTVTQEVWVADANEPGRAFLRRCDRAIEPLS